MSRISRTVIKVISLRFFSEVAMGEFDPPIRYFIIRDEYYRNLASRQTDPVKSSEYLRRAKIMEEFAAQECLPHSTNKEHPPLKGS
jgi:hypothetical protein